MSSSRSSARRRRFQGPAAGRALRCGEPLHHCGDADHDCDAGRGYGELHGDTAEEFVEHQLPQHREQDAEAEDMEGVAPADNEGPRGLTSQEPRLGVDQRFGAGRTAQSSRRTSYQLSLPLSCPAGAALGGMDYPSYADA